MNDDRQTPTPTPGPALMGLPRLLNALASVGAILAVYAVVMFLEYQYVATAHAKLLAGGWETQAIRTYVMPVASGFLVPIAVAMRLLGGLAGRAPQDPVARRLVSAVAMAFAAVVAWGVSEGRHFASPPLRMAFVLGLAFTAGLAALTLLVRIASAPRGVLAALGAVIALVAWSGDAFVLPRLYPAFHNALFLITLGGAALVAVAIPLEQRWGRGLALAFLVIHGFGLAFARVAAERLSSYDNLRLVIAERAPVLGRAVRLASSLAPPKEVPVEVDPGTVGPATSTETSALDFRGRDVLFVSIDALRADHVSAYGYPRATTPNIDRLARSGVRFEAAYCPTPHTSYSVTSVMTGKYMRPLLALGLGEDSDTWAGLFRHYGYRTAAFYPPAVFFIDEARFRAFRERGLDFEYRKVEFASPELRVKQVDDYLSRAPAGQPVFVWVHLFEPHEPYVMHAEHPFGDPAAPKPIDAYDSEIAASDAALGAIAERMRKRRNQLVTIVASDHGEEFGEHGGRYHGTSVYDEQVRVPMIVATEGLPASVVAAPVQTIDLMPTMLAALRIPRPARIRGRDLAPLMVGSKERANDRGFAFAETEDHTMLAEGAHRLVCDRRLGACALYEPKNDPGQTRDMGRAHPEVAARLRARGTDLARSHGRFEHGSSADYPEALRRAMQGDAEAAADVAPLLDDVRLELRRAAAQALYELHLADTAPFAQRAFASASDETLRRWAGLALVRMRVAQAGTPPRELAIALLGAAVPQASNGGLDAPEEGAPGLGRSPVDWRFRAALALAEAGDGRGGSVLASTLERSLGQGTLSFADERATIAALAALREKSAVLALVKALDDVRLRPLAANALGRIGDTSARAPLLATFARERYVSMRSVEAEALLALGARGELGPSLQRFAGVPEPWLDGIRFAQAAGMLLRGRVHGDEGAAFSPSPPRVTARVPASPSRGRRRLYVSTAGIVEVRVGSGLLSPVAAQDDVRAFELAEGEGAEIAAPGGLVAFWVVPHAQELPPPAPLPWDSGALGGSTPE